MHGQRNIKKKLIFCYEDVPHNATKGNNIYLRNTVSEDSCFYGSFVLLRCRK